MSTDNCIDVAMLRAWNDIEPVHPFADVDPARTKFPAGLSWMRPLPQNHFETGSGFFTGVQRLTDPFSDLFVEDAAELGREEETDSDDDDDLTPTKKTAAAAASTSGARPRAATIVRVNLNRRAQSLMAGGPEFIGERQGVGALSSSPSSPSLGNKAAAATASAGAAAAQRGRVSASHHQFSVTTESFSRGSGGGGMGSGGGDLSNLAMMDEEERYAFLANLRTIPPMPVSVKQPNNNGSSAMMITANSVLDAFSAATLIAQLDDEEETMARELSRAAASRAAAAAALEDEQKALQTGGIVGLLRSAVSMNKLRFQQDGFDLDLTYITPRIIAMGFPSTGAESLYRNPLPEVELFFKKRHPGSYRIYNLCSERAYPDPKALEGRHRRFPFDDHNAPSPIKLIPALVKDATQFLQEDPRNVCALHCKAGKGRTGVMISCLLMAVVPSLRSPLAALAYFGSQRAEDGFGVTIASQVRYVKYWGEMLQRHNGEDPQPQRTVTLQRLVIWSTIKVNAAPMDSIFVVIEENNEKKLDTSETNILKPYRASDAASGVTEPHYVFERPGRVPLLGALCGDIRITLYTRTMLGGKDELFHFWFNTTLSNPQGETFGKFELDKACKDKKNHVYCPDLVAQVIFIADVPLKRPQITGPQMPPEMMILAAGGAAASAVSSGGADSSSAAAASGPNSSSSSSNSAGGRGNSPPQPLTAAANGAAGSGGSGGGLASPTQNRVSASASPPSSGIQPLLAAATSSMDAGKPGEAGAGGERREEKGLFARLFGK